MDEEKTVEQKTEQKTEVNAEQSKEIKSESDISDEIARRIAKRRMEREEVPELYLRIKEWIKNTSFKEFVEAIESKVTGQPELHKLLFYIYNYLCNLAYGRKNNVRAVLLAAPSGCGKTFTFRTLKEYFKNNSLLKDIPVVIFDASSLTEAGYQGNEISDMLGPLVCNSDNCRGVGIVVLDELDKLMMPSYASHGQNTHELTQANLLTVIDGTDVDIKNVIKHTVDTNLTFFVGCGAFDACRKQGLKASSHVGFCNNADGGRIDYYEPITREDVIKQGAMTELLGRMSDIINYRPLSEESIDKIIDEIINKLVYEYGIEFSVDDEMRKKLHENANSRYGCRLLDSMIREQAIDILVDRYLNDSENREKIVIGCKKAKVKC